MPNPSQKPVPRRHHYVPQMLLRKFCRAGKPRQIYVFDKQTGKVFSTNTANAAVKKDYYTIDDPTGEFPPNHLEEMISEFETNAAPVLERLKFGATIADDEKHHLAVFVSLSYLRTPSMRRFFGEMSATMAAHVGEVIVSSKERYDEIGEQLRSEGTELADVPYEQVRDFMLDRTKFEMNVDERYTIGILQSIGDFADIFYKMEWRVFRSPPGEIFFISDTPVHFITDPSTHHPLYGGDGIANKTVELLFPLSKNHMLVGRWKSYPLVQTVPARVVEIWNSRTVAHSERYVYGPKDTEFIRDLCAKHPSALRNLDKDGLKVNIKRQLKRG